MASARPGLYQCNACREQFTVTVGRFRAQQYPALEMACRAVPDDQPRKASAPINPPHARHHLQVGVVPVHRLREAMRPAKYPGPLGGLEETVEADETFVGGKATNRKSRKVRAKQAVVVWFIAAPMRARSRFARSTPP